MELKARSPTQDQDRAQDARRQGRGIVWGVAAVVAVLAFAHVRASEPTSGGKPVSYWIEALKGNKFSEAADTLGSIGDKAVPYLIQAIERDRSADRVRMLAPLPRMGPAAQTAVPLLSTLLHDQSAEVRLEAAVVLFGIDCRYSPRLVSTRKEAWSILLDALEGGSASAIEDATATVDYLGADGAPAVPVLIRLVRAGSANARGDAIRALWHIGPSAKEAVPLLEELLARESGDRDSRISIENALSSIKGESLHLPGCEARRRGMK